MIGFDIVIGNPPYIRQENIPNKQTLLNEFENFVCHGKHYKFANSSADIYTYFYAKGLSMLNKGGILSFITSNKWCRANYGKNLRELLLDFCIYSHYDFNGVKAFKEASVDTAITTLYKAKPSNNHIFYYLLYPSDMPLTHISQTIEKHKKPISQSYLTPQSFTFIDSKIASIMAKMEAIGTPLKDWEGISINYGIKTGYNEAFIIDSKKRLELLNACDDSEASLMPFPLSEYDPNLAID